MKNISYIILVGFILLSICSCRNEPELPHIHKFNLNIPDGDTITMSPDGGLLQINAITKDKDGEPDRIFFIGYGGNNNFQQAQTYFWETNEIKWDYKRVEKTAKLEIKPNDTGETRKFLFMFSGGIFTSETMFTIKQDSK